MYPVSANFHTLAIQDAPKTRVRIYFIGDAVDCTDDNAVQTNGTMLIGKAGDTDSNGRIGQNGVVFNELFNPDKNIQIGRAVSSQIGMTLLNTDGALDNFSYGRCKVYLDVYDSANSAWLACPMGVYIIELPTKRKVQLINAVGFDQMTKLDAICDTWWNGLNWSGGLTLLQIVNSMATQLGVSVSSNTASAIVNSSLTYTAAPFDCVEVTYREVLEVIAEATGTVARFDRNGALDLRWLNTPTISGNPVTINTDTVGNQCLALDVAEYTVAKIDLLRAKFAEGDIGVTVGSGANEYVITNNLFLNGANTAAITNKLTPIYNRLYGIAQYTPISGRFIFDWSVEAGDIINIVNDSTTYAVPIFQQTMTWRGGYVVSDLICDGDKTRPVLDSSERDYYRLDSDMRTLVIEAPRINLLGYTTINNGFKVNLDGTFEANGATINGSLVSNGTNTSIKVDEGAIAAIDASNNEVAVIGVGDAGGAVRTTAPGYGSVELDGNTLYVNDENNHPKIIASATAASGGQFTVKNSNGNNAFEVLGGTVYVDGGLSTSGGDINIARNVNIAGGSLNVTGNATITGDVTADDVTAGGVLDVTNRRCYLTPYAPGWYRVLEYNAASSSAYAALRGAIVRINIDVNSNAENHTIFLRPNSTTAPKFVEETSGGAGKVIEKIRYIKKDDNSFAHIDIYFNRSTATNIGVNFEITLSERTHATTWYAINPATSVDAAPSGETILASYDFNTTGTHIDNLNTDTLNGILGIEYTTIANGSSGSITIASSTSAFLLVSGIQATSKFIVSVRCNSSGTVSHAEFGSPGATFSVSANTLTIANSSGGELQILILRF